MPKKKKQPRTTNNESYKNNNDKQEETSSTSQQVHNENINSNINKEVRLLPLEELSDTGFKILPIEISSQKIIFDSDSSDPSTLTSTHYCYFKSHGSRNTNNNDNDKLLPPSSTLFISNLPIDSTEAHIKQLFQECGQIDRIIFNGVIKDDEFLINVVNGSENNEGENNNGLNENGSIQQGIKSKKKKKKKKKSNMQGIEKSVIGHFEEGGLRKLLMPDSSAHIVFQNSEGLKEALEMTQKKRIWTVKDAKIPSLGLSSNILFLCICIDCFIFIL
jgi:hypothetical protein